MRDPGTQQTTNPGQRARMFGVAIVLLIVIAVALYATSRSRHGVDTPSAATGTSTAPKNPGAAPTAPEKSK